ncbi:MAG: PLP-dependent aminotransferase family protein [Verrucomicrobia bacterium]|nr:PLP-dependent aminotransferase family protein [Verrucomicrobiota bacterium]
MKCTATFARRTQHMKRTAVRELLKLTAQPDMISFAGGLPAAELFPIQEVLEATKSVLARVGPAALQYGETEGLGELRDWIASRLARPGLPITRNNVVITTGAQQALDLIGRILLDEGDTVIVENPTYLALLSAWRPLGVRFQAVPSDSDGMRVEELERCIQSRPKLIYTIPNFQNPQGTTLGRDRRQRLAEFVREHNVALLEDDPYGELRFDGNPLPHVLELAARMDSRGDLSAGVLYVGTFSKILMPGLRVGWVIAIRRISVCCEAFCRRSRDTPKRRNFKDPLW